MVSKRRSKRKPAQKLARASAQPPSKPRVSRGERPLPVYRAKVLELAENTVAGNHTKESNLDDTVLARIRKCLEKAMHPGTPEAEAKTAFHMASRMMAHHNVTQSQVLKDEPREKQRQYGGRSVVSIERRDGNSGKLLRKPNFLDALLRAFQTFFDCKSYKKRHRTHLTVVFYGISENTAAAAMAFEAAYNLITEWALAFKGIRSRNSYCAGIADELCRTAKREKAQEENPSSTWLSHGQLMAFRETSSRIADDFLASQSIKLSASSRRRSNVRDPQAYKQGVKDSSKVDVRRQRIQD